MKLTSQALTGPLRDFLNQSHHVRETCHQWGLNSERKVRGLSPGALLTPQTRRDITRVPDCNKRMLKRGFEREKKKRGLFGGGGWVGGGGGGGKRGEGADRGGGRTGGRRGGRERGGGGPPPERTPPPPVNPKNAQLARYPCYSLQDRANYPTPTGSWPGSSLTVRAWARVNGECL